MTTTNAFALRQSGFNDFLFAPVGTEASGMTLILVSVFARAGNDPWVEAGRLAELSKSEATESLARSIAGMPASIWPHQAAMAIASRLIVLLPNGSKGAVQRPAVTVFGSKAGQLLGIAIILISVACMLAFQAGLFATSAPPNPDGSGLAGFMAPARPVPGVATLPSPPAPARSPTR